MTRIPCQQAKACRLALAGTVFCLVLPHQIVAQVQSDPGAGLVQALRTPQADVLRSHVRFLSHDLLEGRATGSRGGRIAAQYIASQFEGLGLQPGSRGESFVQSIALIRVESEASLTVGSRQQTMTFEPSRDFVAWPEVTSLPATSDGEVVFVGFGIRAPQWNWDDFEGASLAGRILLVLAGEPMDSETSAFEGDRMTHYGTLQYKLDQAARVGAKGVLLVHPNEGAILPWEAVRNTWSADRFFFERPRESNLEFSGWITESTARRIAAASDRDFDLLVRRASQRSFQPISIGAHAVMRIRGSSSQTDAWNVLASLEGRDPAVSDEHVVLVAHHDHLGVGALSEVDRIYNGAEGNASGVAVLLAAAAGFASTDVRPRRSLLFLTTSGSEVGQVGTHAFLTDPPLPVENIVAVVNLDRMSVRGRTTDIVGLGAEASGLGTYLAQVAEAEGVAVVPDPAPEAGWFYRGDQLPFAQAGVAAMRLRPGWTVVDRPAGWGQREERRYLEERFNRPSDEERDDWDYEGLIQDTRIVIRLGWMLAEVSEFPSWPSDSEFGPAASQLRLRRLRRTRTQTNHR